MGKWTFPVSVAVCLSSNPLSKYQGQPGLRRVLLVGLGCLTLIEGVIPAVVISKETQLHGATSVDVATRSFHDAGDGMQHLRTGTTLKGPNSLLSTNDGTLSVADEERALSFGRFIEKLKERLPQSNIGLVRCRCCYHYCIMCSATLEKGAPKILTHRKHQCTWLKL